MSSATLLMAINEKTLTGDKRLALIGVGDNGGRVSVSSVAHWCNIDEARAQAIIDEMTAEGWFSHVDGELIQAQMFAEEHLVRAVRRAKPQKSYKISIGRRREIYDRDGWLCHYCGSGKSLTLDHKVPVSQGGSNSDANLVTCCKSCNSSKGTKSYDEFIAWRSVNA